ncbi:MAG: hypothetical protein ACYTX0_27640 [Nostoc sp.]
MAKLPNCTNEKGKEVAIARLKMETLFNKGYMGLNWRKKLTVWRWALALSLLSYAVPPKC